MTQSPPIPISKLIGGINGFEAEAAQDQCVEALDVWEREGDLLRRPALKPIATGAPYLLPSGSTSVKLEDSGGSFSTFTHRNPSFSATQVGGTASGRLWVGAYEQFDGIDVRHITAVLANPSLNSRVVVRYRDGEGFLLPAHGVVDTTSRRGSLSSSSGKTFQPFMQDGRISWHRSQFVDWSLTSLDSTSRYWVAIDFCRELPTPDEDPDAVTLSGTGSITIDAPGIRAFVINPVNGLYSAKMHNQTKAILVGTDRKLRRGHEAGGNHGVIRNMQTETEITRIVQREGSAVIGVNTQPAPTSTGGATHNEGTSGTVTKFDNTYSLSVNELRGAILLTVVGGSGSTSTSVVAAVPTSAGNANFEHCWLVCTAGNNSGQYREIIRYDTTGPDHFDVYPAFTGGTTVGDTFDVVTPPSYIRSREGKRNYQVLSNTAGVITLVPTSAGWVSVRATLDTNRYINFEAVHEAPWVLQPGHQYVYAYNTVTGNVLFTNGENGILEFDGIRTRRLRALFDNTDGVDGAAKVQTWTGNLQDLARELNNPDINLGSQLRRNPPNAKLITTFASRVVVTLREDPTVIQWTAPGAFNDIWPAVYSTSIRDVFSQPITGLFPLHDQLIATTPTSMFAADAPGEDGFLIFRPIVQGVGFLNQNSVGRIAAGAQVALIGPNSDGITLWTGSTPSSVVDDWHRIIPGGINPRALSGAVGAIWQQEQIYFCAVPSSGSSVNNKIIVVDYSANKVWVWSAPFGGITSIARDYDDAGVERVLFGTADGHVCVLSDLLYDGSASITGSAKSAPISFEGQTMAYTNLRVMCEELGSSTLSVKTYLNFSGSKQTLTKTFNGGGSVFGTDVYGTGTHKDRKQKSVMFNFRAGGYDGAVFTPAAVGETFQYQVSSAARFRFRGAHVLAQIKGVRFK